MFSKAKPKTTRATPTVPPTILSSDSRVSGDFTSDGEVQIDGIVKGDVKCSRLSVGSSGHIQGEIIADTALIRGKVEGQISAKNVTLTRTARVVGDIVHDTLTIEPGAHLDGHCKRMDSPAAISDDRPEAKINLVVSEAKKTAG